jgi:hypothetical protein
MHSYVHTEPPDFLSHGYLSRLAPSTQEVAARERDGAMGGPATVASAPGFGTSASPWAEVAAFYAFWGEFVSKLSFGWADEYREQDAPSRSVCSVVEMMAGTVGRGGGVGGMG